jgi:hypothetical protein
VNAISRSAVLIVAAAVAAAAGGCSDFIRRDRAPVTLVIDRLEAASGAAGSSAPFTGTLQSDVTTVVDGVSTIFSDSGRVTMRLVMKDVLAAPSPANAVTINRYRITFRRSDGRNTPGIDVPHPFDSAVSFTVDTNATVAHTFELIRHAAKEEAPLRALATNFAVTIATVADITFYGRDQVGNELSASGSIGVTFGNFGDPD